MPKNRQRSGLQKDFSAIFQGVWIPKKTRAARPAQAQNPPEQGRQTEQKQTEHIEQIEQIISSMTCSKGFECFKSGFKNLCKAKIVGDGKIIECSPENKRPCEYRFCFVDKSFCKCRLRYYVAMNFNK
jgi:hypothetical protein